MTRKLFLTAYALMFIVLQAGAQVPNAVWGLNSVYGFTTSESMATDAEGNVYITGIFFGGVDFDFWGLDMHNVNTTLGEDAFLVKYDAEGNFLWAKNICGITGSHSQNKASGYAVAVDAAGGNVYVTGYFDGTADFDPSAQVLSYTTAGDRDIFLTKYSAEGDFLDVKIIGGAGRDAGVAIDIDGSGNVYLAGYFTYAVDFDPSGQTVNLTSGGNRDIFLAKYDANIGLIWAKSMPGAGLDLAYAVVVDGANNVYLAGAFEGTVDFDPSASTVNRTSQGASDIFLAKYDANGGYIWAQSMGGVGVDEARGMAVDSTGNVYIGGHFNNTLDLDPSGQSANFISFGGQDIYTAKYDINGNYVWGRAFGSTAHDAGFAVAVDAENNVYTTGYFSGATNFNPSGVADSFAIRGAEDIFLIKYSENGDYIGGRAAGSSGIDHGNAIAIDPFGYVYITGPFNASLTISPTLVLPSSNNNKLMHLIKYESCVVNIPDINFRNYLLGNSAINTNGDSLIHCNEARIFAGSMNCNNLNIADVTGLEAFVNVSGIAFRNNQLTRLDVSHNIAINHIFCGNNQIASLNLSNNTMLEGLECRSNQLTSLNLSQNVAIDSIDIRNNRLRSLNLANGNNTNLQELWIYSNPDLDCVQVDDSLYSAANWVNGNLANDDPYLFDAGLRFGENCATTIAVNQISASNILAVYPNPSGGVLNIETSADITVSIVNILGENIISQQLNIGNNVIDVGQLASGIYFLKDEKNRALKFVKE